MVEYRGSPKKEFKSKIRDITKDFENHDKEGFPHLEEVERKIRARRRNNLQANPSAERAKQSSDKPGVFDRFSLSGKKGPGPRNNSKSMQNLVKGQKVTPDDLYKFGKGTGPGKTSVDGHKVNQKMVNEMITLREEISSLRAKLRALEEEQMSVDNLQLAKQLEKEKEELGKERMALLKDYAKKEDALEGDRKAFGENIAKKERDLEARFRELENRQQKLEVDKIDLEDKLLDAENRLNQIAAEEKELQRQRAELASKISEVERQKEDLEDFNE